MLRSLEDYYADSPIEDATADAFGRTSFASRMAIVVDQMGSQSRSSVAALVGPWGSGKSSVLNLFAANLRADPPTWTIRRFNPWLYNDVNSLLANYFSELVAAMPDGAIKETMRNRIGGYLGRIAPLGKAGSLFGFDIEGVIESAGDILSAPKTLTEQKDDLARALGDLDHRILIIMDDIDRLQPEELLLVLKLIRLIGELPNVHYLLAYDERTLLDVLMATPIGNNDEDRAAQYVDKMVQVRFDLPPLTDFQAENVFTPGYLKILASIGHAISDEEFRRLGSFYEEHMQATLRVPRRINKYFAQLSAFLTDEIAEELNVVDFSILTYIRTFHGTLYARLTYWKSSLIGGMTLYELTRGSDTPSKRREQWVQRFSASGIPAAEVDAVLALLAALFPAIDDLTDRVRITGISAKGAALNKHLASAEYFDRYFQFAVPDNDVSDSLVADALNYLLEGVDATDSYAAFLDRMRTDPTLVLDKCRLLTDTHRCVAPMKMLRLLSDQYESYDWHERRLFRSPQDLARYLAFDILRRMPIETQEEVVEDLAINGALTFVLELTFTISKSDSRPIPGWFSTLKRALDTRFRDYIDNRMTTLEEITYDEFAPFRTWGQIASDGEARDLAQAKVRGGEWSLERYLAYLTGTSYLVGVQNPIPRLSGFEAAWIETFIGIDFAIAELGPRLDDSPPAPELYEAEGPTYDQRRRYALGVLQDLRMRRADRTSDAHE